MVNTSQDHAAVRVSPPLVFTATVAAAVLLHRLVLPLPLGLPESVRGIAATGALLFGAGFMVTSLALFHRTGQDPTPWKSTPEMIFRGPYRISRNPIYLGMALLQGGAGLYFSNGWIIGLLPLALLWVYLTAIRHEETYLECKFGDAYLDYKSSVRRWI